MSFSASFAAAVPAGQIITATATDPNNNTSEFSECVEVEGEPTPIAVGGIAEIRTDADAPPAASRGSDDSALLMVVLGLGAVLVLSAGGLYVVKMPWVSERWTHCAGCGFQEGKPPHGWTLAAMSRGRGGSARRRNLGE